MRKLCFCISTLFIATVLSSCSRSPRVTFYTLNSEVKSEAVLAAPHNGSLLIESVTLPDIVDRPQLVVRTNANRVEILETHRWAESLKSGIPRLIADDLEGMLGTVKILSSFQHSVGNPEYRVLIDFVRFEATPGDSVNIEAEWSLGRVLDGTPITGHFHQREQVNSVGYESIVAAYSRVLNALSEDIAKSFRSEFAVKQ
ncbi:MAG: PqiC family protein [Desulfuromonadaceae bacterium]|nr:PqiC family protein [Desulfuromonadaceae bacterium]MDD2856069.1 PqiC family protein [Desulfuromonadaceae bacterium]